jgi:hypothetical protein
MQGSLDLVASWWQSDLLRPMMSASHLIIDSMAIIRSVMLSSYPSVARRFRSVLKIAVLKDLPLHVHHFSRREGSNFKTKRYPKKRSTGPKSLTMSSGSIGLQDAVESKEYLCWKRSESVNQNHRPGRCSMIQASNTFSTAYFACNSMLITV